MVAKRSIAAADLLVLAVPLLALFPLHNNDLWWHLAAGRWIVEHGAVPHDDPFSWTHYLGRWIDNEWLSEVLFYGLWRIGGNGALVALRALAFTGLALLLRAYTGALRVPRAFPMALAAAIALTHHWWELRPSVGSLLALLLLATTIERARSGRDRLWLLPLLFLVWANAHPGFFLGLLVLIVTTLAVAIDPLIPAWARSGRGALVAPRLALVTLASAAATLVNPYGWRVYEQQFAIAGNREYRALVDEWLVPPLGVLLLILVCAALALASPRRVPLSRLALFFAGATLAITAVRFGEYFAWLSLPVVLTLPMVRKQRPAGWLLLAAALLAGWWPPAASPSVLRTAPYHELLVWQRGASLVAAALAVAAVLLPRRRRQPAGALLGAAVLAIALVLPWRRFDYIEANRYPGRCLATIPRGARLFNRLSWGGWLLWRAGLAPLIDGRCSGQPLFFDYVAAQVRYARPLLERWRIDYVVVAPEDGAAAQLAAAPEWGLVCRDDASLVFRRAGNGMYR